MALSSGDTVTTGPTGHAEVRLNRGGSVESDTGTTVQVADRSDPGFWRGLVVSGNEYLSCLSRVVFTSGQIYWTGTGQATCFDPSGLGNIVARSQFNLQLAPGRDVLTVAEGQVTVSALQQLTVPANMQISIANGRVIDQRQVSREELDRITAWRRWRDFWRPYVPRPIPPVIPRVAPPTIGPR